MPDERTTASVLSTPTGAQYVALRGWLQGRPPQAVVKRWLATDPDAVWSEAAVQRALRHDLQRLVDALASGSRAAAFAATILADRQREVERLSSPAPNHAVARWFGAQLAYQLADAGAGMLGELAVLGNDRGAAGAAGCHTRRVAEATFGCLGAHVSGAAPPAPLALGQSRVAPQ